MLRDRCAGILRLADCEVKERPTNKDGFSFKLYHLLHYPIYHKYGLRGETIRTAMLPVSWNYCIVRVSSEQERKSWMDAINAQIDYANTLQETRASARVEHPVNDSYDMEVLSEDEEEKEKPESTVIPPMHEPSTVELADDLFQRNNEVFQKNLLDGLSDSQNRTSKSIQKKTLKSMEEWKKEVDVRLVNMERRLTNTIKQNSAVSHTTKSRKLEFSYVQFFILLVVALTLGRYIPVYIF